MKIFLGSVVWSKFTLVPGQHIRHDFRCVSLPATPRFIAPPRDTALHPSTTVPLPAFMILSLIVLYLEMASYGTWLFNQTRSLSRANPSYQLAVVGNFVVAGLGPQVCAALL